MIVSALLGLLIAASTVDSQLIAEVVPSAEGAAALRGLDERAAPSERTPRVVLWRLSNDNARQVLAALDAKLPGHFAAVFHEGPKLRVPAGGVLVWLAPGADLARLIEDRRLKVVRNFGSGVVLFDSAPGVETLQLSARLESDARVLRAMPNWWLKAVKR